MIQHELLRDEGISIVRPVQPLEADDFAKLAEEVDPYLEQHGPLTGLVLEAPKFPGWKNFEGFIAHFCFVRDHHRKIRKVAAVTNDSFLSILPTVANHFVSAEVRHFSVEEQSAALDWIRQNRPPVER